jgi:flagellar biogenesis protein FliO
MLTYITAFIFYTLAMVGILLLGFVIYKKTILPSRQDNKGLIKILDKTAISPKKSLLVVRVKNEKFLIALDAERTTFLSKLEDEKQNVKEQKVNKTSFEQNTNYIDDVQQRKLDNIQKQFKQLYSNQEPKIDENLTRKEMIRKLLKDLNDTTGSLKTGSY